MHNCEDGDLCVCSISGTNSRPGTSRPSLAADNATCSTSPGAAATPHRGRWTERLLQIGLNDTVQTLTEARSTLSESGSEENELSSGACTPVSLSPKHEGDGMMDSLCSVTSQGSFGDSENGSDNEDDVELPQMYSPSTCTKGRGFHENDVVWVKHKSTVYLPAVVKKVSMWKRRQRIKLEMCYPPDHKTDSFTVKRVNNIFHFQDSRHEQFMRDGYSAKDNDSEFFKKCLDVANNFIFTNSLKKYKQDAPEGTSSPNASAITENDANPTQSRKRLALEFDEMPSNSCDQPTNKKAKRTSNKKLQNGKLSQIAQADEHQNSDSNFSDTITVKKRGRPRKAEPASVGVKDKQAKSETLNKSTPVKHAKSPVKNAKGKSVNKQNSDIIVTKVIKGSNMLSKKGQERLDKMRKKNEPLVQFLVSEECKSYLKKIYQGEIASDLHKRFITGTWNDRSLMMHRGFGPLDNDDDQIETVLLEYSNLLKKIGDETCQSVHYIIDVWVPEAMVFALKKLKKYTTKKAWEMFDKGVKMTKEEHQLMHKELRSGW